MAGLSTVYRTSPCPTSPIRYWALRESYDWYIVGIQCWIQIDWFLDIDWPGFLSQSTTKLQFYQPQANHLRINYFPRVSQLGAILPPRRYLAVSRAFLVVQMGGCYWHLGGARNATTYASYNIWQLSTKILWPKMPRLRNPDLVNTSLTGSGYSEDITCKSTKRCWKVSCLVSFWGTLQRGMSHYVCESLNLWI